MHGLWHSVAEHVSGKANGIADAISHLQLKCFWLLAPETVSSGHSYLECLWSIFCLRIAWTPICIANSIDRALLLAGLVWKGNCLFSKQHHQCSGLTVFCLLVPIIFARQGCVWCHCRKKLVCLVFYLSFDGLGRFYVQLSYPANFKRLEASLISIRLQVSSSYYIINPHFGEINQICFSSFGSLLL